MLGLSLGLGPWLGIDLCFGLCLVLGLGLGVEVDLGLGFSLILSLRLGNDYEDDIENQCVSIGTCLAPYSLLGTVFTYFLE